MPVRRWMLVVWACFAARLLFYSAMLPMWEGYDEWAHFAVVRRMVVHGELLVSRQVPVAKDIEASLQLAPVPWELRTQPPPAFTHDDFWQLDATPRHHREQLLAALPADWQTQDSTGGLTAYEALQPPLYYWLMAGPLAICRAAGFGLAAQMLALRFLSSLLASMIVPAVFLVGARVWEDQRVALGCAAVAAVMPGLALDVARVGNDSLAVLLFSLLTWLLLRTVKDGLWIGITLGLGLLTKAYFLTAVPAVAVILLALCLRKRATLRSLALAAVIPLLLAGWWYGHNLATTGTLSGLSESVMLRGSGAGDLLAQAASIHWSKAIDSILFSHLYFGGWSSLTVRSWMYHLFYLAIAAAFGGICFSLSALPKQENLLTLLALYLCFWLGQLYNVVLLFASKGLGGSMGWYMYAVVAAEIVLTVAGLRALLPPKAHRWIPAAGALLFALLDLYTVHIVAIPYYTGMLRHRANGSLAALHWPGFQSVGLLDAIARLTAFKPVGPLLLIALWLLYLIGTLTAVIAAAARKCEGAANPQG